MHRRDDLVFPPAEFERRLTELYGRMGDRDLDALLVTTPENITYLTGFESPGRYWFQGLVVPIDGAPGTISRALEQAGIDAYTWLKRNIGYHDSEEPERPRVEKFRDPHTPTL